MEIYCVENLNEIKDDFKKLSLKEQDKKLQNIMHHYCHILSDDIRSLGFASVDTKKTKELYDILRFEYEKELDRISD